MIITRATFGVRRPMSTTFVDNFKGYNFVVYTKIKFEEEEGQICRIRARTNPAEALYRFGTNRTDPLEPKEKRRRLGK
jgi:hypothetical protein